MLCVADSGLTNGGSYNNINTFAGGGGGGGFAGFKASGVYGDTIRKPTRSILHLIQTCKQCLMMFIIELKKLEKKKRCPPLWPFLCFLTKSSTKYKPQLLKVDKHIISTAFYKGKGQLSIL